MESDGGMTLTGESRSTRSKTYPSATLSTTNPTWTDPGANQGLRGEKPSTNHLSHGTASNDVTSLVKITTKYFVLINKFDLAYEVSLT
jgi:hypothetical protein